MKRNPTHARPAASQLLAGAALLAALWTPAAQAQTALRRDLIIDGDFGFVSAVTADRQGRIYVADDQVEQLLAFDAAGARLRMVGGSGAGPGEFRGLQSVVAGRGDTLFVFDANQRRITAFAPGAERRVAYTVSVQTVGRELPSQQLLVPSRGPFLLTFTAPFEARPGTSAAPDEGRSLTLRTVDRRGRLGAQPVLRSRDKDAMVTRRGGSVSVGPLPYGRAPFFALGPDDRLYHGWSASADVSAHDLQGRRVGTVRTGVSPLRVSAADVDALTESYPQGQALENLRLALREKRVPETKPAFKSMLVDDQGRLWVNVTTAGDVVVMGGAGLAYETRPARGGGQPGATPWWVFDAAGRRVAIYTVPGTVTLREVRGGRAYGIDVDEDGVQRVVRYVVGR